MRQNADGWSWLMGAWTKQIGHITLEIVERGDAYQAALIKNGHPVRARPVHSGVEDAKLWAEEAAAEYFEAEVKVKQSAVKR